jgi:hypothetical protein
MACSGAALSCWLAGYGMHNLRIDAAAMSPGPSSAGAGGFCTEWIVKKIEQALAFLHNRKSCSMI